MYFIRPIFVLFKHLYWAVLIVNLILRAHCFAHDIIIETEDDLLAVGGSSTCNSYADGFSAYCKRSPGSNLPSIPSTTGFWSSCEQRNCQIAIRLGDLGFSRVPDDLSMEIVAAATGPVDAEIQVRYIANGEPFVIIDSFLETGSWETRIYNLLEIIEFINLDTEIVIRFASQQPDAHDILDTIKFISSEAPVPGSTTDAANTEAKSTEVTVESTSTESATTEATIGNIIIETEEDFLAVGGVSTCNSYADGFNAYCKRTESNLPSTPSTTGFWSSCEQRNCQIAIRLGDLGFSRVPDDLSMEIVAAATGPVDAEIQVRYIANGEPFVIIDSFLETGSWETRIYNLLEIIEFINLDTEIVIRFASQQPNAHDILDTITFITSKAPVPGSTTDAETTDSSNTDSVSASTEAAPSESTSTATTTMEGTPSEATTEGTPSEATTEGTPSEATTERTSDETETEWTSDEAATTEAITKDAEKTTSTSPSPAPSAFPTTDTDEQTRPSPTSGPTQPSRPPDEPRDPVELNLNTDKSLEWAWTCEYSNVYEDYEDCEIDVLSKNISDAGFWSSCASPSCAIEFTPEWRRRTFQRPNFIQIRSYLRGLARIDVFIQSDSGVIFVSSVSNSMWEDTKLDIRRLEFKESWKILIELKCTEYPACTDLIDLLVVTFDESLPTSTPSTTLRPTTRVPPSTAPASEGSNDNQFVIILLAGIAALFLLLAIALALKLYFVFKRKSQGRKRLDSDSSFDDRPIIHASRQENYPSRIAYSNPPIARSPPGPPGYTNRAHFSS